VVFVAGIFFGYSSASFYEILSFSIIDLIGYTGKSSISYVIDFNFLFIKGLLKLDLVFGLFMVIVEAVGKVCIFLIYVLFELLIFFSFRISCD